MRLIFGLSLQKPVTLELQDSKFLFRSSSVFDSGAVASAVTAETDIKNQKKKKNLTIP
jgi:hypothetical protein